MNFANSLFSLAIWRHFSFFWCCFIKLYMWNYFNHTLVKQTYLRLRCSNYSFSDSHYLILLFFLGRKREHKIDKVQLTVVLLLYCMPICRQYIYTNISTCLCDSARWLMHFLTNTSNFANQHTLHLFSSLINFIVFTSQHLFHNVYWATAKYKWYG